MFTTLGNLTLLMNIAFKKYIQSIQIQTVKLIGLFILALLFAACSNNENNEEDIPIEQEPDPALGPKPVLWNLGVDFDTAFTLDGAALEGLKFYEFGFEVVGNNNEIKALPHFSYALDSSTEIISPMKGYVASIHLQDAQSQDYAIWLKPHGGPTAWLVEFDHISRLAVAEGDEVDIGDLLGYPTGRGIEMMVNGPDAHVCPWQVFASEALAKEIQMKLNEHMLALDAAKWELPEDDPYHPEHIAGYYISNPSMNTEVPGCLMSEIPYER